MHQVTETQLARGKGQCTVPPILVSWRRLSDLLGFDQRFIKQIADECGKYYEPFDRRKIFGSGKWRHIDNPQGPLKVIQRRIQDRLLANVSLPKGMIGGVRGLSALDHARLHVQQPCLVTLDIKDCFPSLKPESVFNVFINNVGCSGDIAHYLTQLTTFQHRLPQGAPTSPMLANLVLIPLYQDLVSIAASLALQCSIYVDDIALSGYLARDAILPASLAIRKYGLCVSRRKIIIMSKNKSQTVTGIAVNSGIDLTSEKKINLFDEIIELSSARIIYEHDLNSINGKIRYVKTVCPAAGEWLSSIAQKYLPSSGQTGIKPKRGETRTCTRYVRDHSGKQSKHAARTREPRVQ